MGKVYISGVSSAMLPPFPANSIARKMVGESVFMKVDGVRKEFIVVQQRKPNSPLYDLSCDGAWCLTKDIYEERQWNNADVNSYEGSTIDQYLNGPWFNRLDDSAKKAVMNARIPYRVGAGPGLTPVNSGNSGLPVRAFLLGMREVGYGAGDTGNTSPDDGIKLQYFVAGDDGAPKRIARLNGLPKQWKVRSPFCDPEAGQIYTCSIDTSGGWAFTGSSAVEGIRPCLILKPNTLLDRSGNVIG